MKTVVYLTCTKLPCTDVLQAPVILCLKDTIELLSGTKTLPALLATSQEIFDDCECLAYWRYTLAYDETLLVDPEVLLVPDDILGIFCETCFTDWVKELIAQAILEAQI